MSGLPLLHFYFVCWKSNANICIENEDMSAGSRRGPKFRINQVIVSYKSVVQLLPAIKGMHAPLLSWLVALQIVHRETLNQFNNKQTIASATAFASRSPAKSKNETRRRGDGQRVSFFVFFISFYSLLRCAGDVLSNRCMPLFRCCVYRSVRIGGIC